MASHQIDISEYEKDPRLFLFTSLTAGSSHIITATSRMETILKANKIPFQAIDLATDEKARRLWQRRARERKLPGLVKEGFVLGDLDEVEEWNEFGELKENIGSVPSNNDTAANTVKTGVNIAPPIPIKPTATQGTTNISTPPVNKAPKPGVDESKFRPLPGAAEIAERNKPKPEPQEEAKSVIDENVPPSAAAEKMTSAPDEKRESINAAKDMLGKVDAARSVEHLSAPPSALQSGTATPTPESEKAAEPVAAEKLDDDGGDKSEPVVSAEAAGEETLTHRGSEVEDAPSEEVKKVEGETALAETAEEGDGGNAEGVTESAAPEATTTETKTPVDDNKDETSKSSEEVKEPAAAEVAATETTASVDEAKDETTKSSEKAADAPTAPDVVASDAGEGKFAEDVTEQSAKEPDDAGKSVGD